LQIAYIALVVVYVFICFFLILVVLLQQGKGADIAGAFGGGGTQTAFGARGATTLLHKLTTGAFVGFIVLSMLLTVLQARPKGSVIRNLPATAAPTPGARPPATGAPAQTGTTAPPAAPGLAPPVSQAPAPQPPARNPN